MPNNDNVLHSLSVDINCQVVLVNTAVKENRPWYSVTLSDGLRMWRSFVSKEVYDVAKSNLLVTAVYRLDLELSVYNQMLSCRLVGFTKKK